MASNTVQVLDTMSPKTGLTVVRELTDWNKQTNKKKIVLTWETWRGAGGGDLIITWVEKVQKRWGRGRGGGEEQNLVVPETISFVTKLISKNEITLTDMKGVRGFISMTIAYYQQSHVWHRQTCILTRTLLSWSWASDLMFGARSLTFMFGTKPFLIRNEFSFKRSI